MIIEKGTLEDGTLESETHCCDVCERVITEANVHKIDNQELCMTCAEDYLEEVAEKKRVKLYS